MFIFSFLLHLGVFCLVLFIPDSIPTRTRPGVVYQVDLVELPSKKVAHKKGTGKKISSKKGRVIKKKRKSTKRVGRLKAREKPIRIAKRTVKTKKKRPRKIESPEKLLNSALAKIEKNVQHEEKHDAILNKAIERIKTKVAEEPGAKATPGTGGAVTGITIQIYRMEVETKIKNNWAYPVALSDPKSIENLEAVVILTVRRDGSIIKSEIKKRSGNPIFDESVLKAIERSEPLPPFPEGFLKSSEEIEINFNLRELQS